MKHGWGKYATKTRLLEKGYFRKHCHRGKSGEKSEAGGCNCLFCRQKKQEKIEKKDEEIRKEINSEASREGRQGIPEADQRRHSIEEITQSEEGEIMAKAKLGSGARFKAVEKSAAKSGAENPAAVAYIAGVKAHGKKEMTKLSKMGKNKST